MSTPLLKVQNLRINFKAKHQSIYAVRNVSFEIQKGETLGLVGESGCGKTTIGKSLIGLVKPKSGNILFEGSPLSVNKRQRDIQMIFQDPYSSLNPRMTVTEIIGEPLQIYKMGTKKQQKARVLELLRLVGLDDSYAHRYPHELSGGQRQRICIARALAPNPKCIICDEPIAALDVSIQAQIINLLKQLQKDLGLTYLFISHDLSIVKYMCDRVAVMYFGDLVEEGTSDQIYTNPQHDYTKTLISSAEFSHYSLTEEEQVEPEEELALSAH